MSKRSFLPVIASLCVLSLPSLTQNATADEPRKLDLDLDPDVLVFTEPLREDGTVDYIAAINEHMSNGVTQQNNAFRALYLVMPPEELWDNDFEKAYYKAMDTALAVAPDERDTLPKYTAWHDYASERGLTRDQIYSVFEEQAAGTYTDEIGRVLKAWLEKNEPAFDYLASEVWRPQYWVPMISGDPSDTLLIDQAQRSHFSARQLARGLRLRTHYLASQGKEQPAIDSLLAILQLATLQSQSPLPDARNNANAIHRQAGMCLRELLRVQWLDSTSMASIATEWQGFSPSLDEAIESIGQQRLIVFDAMMQIASGRQNSRRAIFGANQGRDKETFFDLALRSEGFALNMAISRASSYYDAQQAMMQKETYAQYAALRKPLDTLLLAEKIDATQALLSTVNDEITLQPGLSGKDRAEHLTSILLYTLDTTRAALLVEFRWHAEFRALTTAIAIERYRLAHNRLPPSLGALVPVYLESVPSDPFDGKPLRYKTRNEGFVVYAVDRNLEDDGGPAGPDGDDLVFEVTWSADQEEWQQP